MCTSLRRPSFAELKSHLVDIAEESGLLEDDFDSFVEYRSGSILDEIRRMTGKMTEVEIDLKGDEAVAIEKFELQMRELLHRLLVDQNPDYWSSTGDEIFRGRIEERITDWLKRNPGRTRKEAREVDFLQVLEYLKVARAHWAVFGSVFRSKSDLEMHLKNITNFRNALMHNRELDVSTRQLAFGSLTWFDKVFKAHQ